MEEEPISFEEPVGIVEHYYPKAQAAVVRVQRGELHKGDQIHIVGAHDDVVEAVERIELDHEPVDIAREGQIVGVFTRARVHENDQVFLVH
jgi:U32 family peptidase